jgi:molybdopterin molybdotransferase
MPELLTVHEAQERILAIFSARPVEIVPLLSAYHRVLAQEIQAAQDLPPFTNSSMDGYAVISTDLAIAAPQTPRTLRVVAEIPAGSVSSRALSSGETARIMTGAPLPEGADAVVPLEDVRLETTGSGEAVVFFHPAAPGACRPARFTWPG